MCMCVCVYVCVCIRMHTTVFSLRTLLTHSSGVSRAGSLAATNFVSSSRPDIAASRTLQETALLDRQDNRTENATHTNHHATP